MIEDLLIPGTIVYFGKTAIWTELTTSKIEHLLYRIDHAVTSGSFAPHHSSSR